MSDESIQRIVQPSVSEDDQLAPGLTFGDPHVMVLILVLILVRTLCMALATGICVRSKPIGFK